MSVPPRGARNRRSGRRPGWQLLTVLLVLAILASSTIVFTNKVELLRLAVILSLWAAVLAAFVSVVYRRQSELDQARARDMKYVYDLQLDREIAARREYELGVEAHLRRQLSRELRTEAGEEMAALRAELISLRSHLEALLGTDLGDRPALESDRVTMAPPPQLGRVESSRVTAVISEQVREVADESVTEVALTEVAVTEVAVTEVAVTEVAVTEVAVTEETIVEETVVEETVVEEVTGEAPVPEEPAAPETGPVVQVPVVEAPREPVFTPPPPPPVAPTWQFPPEYRGSHRRPQEAPAAPAMAPPRPPVPPVPPPPQPVAAQQPVAPWRPPEAQPRRGRHWVPDEPVQPPAAAEAGRHRGEAAETEQPADEGQSQHTGGHSVADLMARLQVNGQVGGGGRRRRED